MLATLQILMTQWFHKRLLFAYRCNLIKRDSKSKRKAAECYFIGGTVFREKKYSGEHKEQYHIHIQRVEKEGKNNI